MKKGLFIVVVILFCLGVLYISHWHKQAQVRRAAIFELLPHRTNILVTTEQAFTFRHDRGVGVVNFTSVGYDESTYRYRALMAESATEIQDTINARSRHTRLGPIVWDTSPSESRHIHAGDIRIAWSYHNPDMAWITYHTNLTSIEIIDSAEYDSIDLFELRDNLVQPETGCDS